jgi:dephospho-CoA kinase
MGSGKSTVAEIFAELGAFWIDYDQLSHQLDVEDPQMSAEIATSLGVAPGLSSQEIAGIVFADPDKLRRLEAIKHPRILAMAERIQTENQANFNVFVHEVPLLVEANLSDGFDFVVVVIADREIRIERAERERGWSREEIVSRMASQADDSTRLKIADYVIENNSDLAELKFRVREIWREINSD